MYPVKEKALLVLFCGVVSECKIWIWSPCYTSRQENIFYTDYGISCFCNDLLITFYKIHYSLVNELYLKCCWMKWLKFILLMMRYHYNYTKCILFFNKRKLLIPKKWICTSCSFKRLLIIIHMNKVFIFNPSYIDNIGPWYPTVVLFIRVL